MLEIQPYQLIGQSLQDAVQYLIDTKKSSYFRHIYSLETPNTITLSVQPKSGAKRLVSKHQIPLIDYLIIEVLEHYVHESLSETRSSITASKPALVNSVWQHILTYFVLNKCSPLVLAPATDSTSSTVFSSINNFNFWSDEQAYNTLQRIIKISVQCADHEPNDYANANEYLISVLQKMATTGCLFSM